MDYQLIIDYVLKAGKELKSVWGSVQDIGVTKRHLTEYDLKIERDIKRIITSFGQDHSLFAEEENHTFSNSKNVWVADPISGTAWFLNRAGSFAIVVSHVCKGKTEFGLVYDPVKEDLFTATRGKGLYINGVKHTNTTPLSSSVLFNPSMGYKDIKKIHQVWNDMYSLNPYKLAASFGLGYAYVAAGRFAGVVTLAKDVFPEFAGNILIQESGGIFTNAQGSSIIGLEDRIFVGAHNKETHEELLQIVNSQS
jgi:myo-inositol-1(or 4)-monophosphatase